MAKAKKTYHESWYRVAELKLSLHPSLQVHRQQYRQRLWFIIEDPISHKFFRLNESAYRFIGLLDGKRSVEEVWLQCLESQEEKAPGQGEIISLLGRLFNANLLLGDLPFDAEVLLKRQEQRFRKETQAYLKGILFAKIPLWDPDTFLDKSQSLVRLFFSKAAWLIFPGLVFAAVYFLITYNGQLSEQSQGALSSSNIAYLYLTFVLVKIAHEFGHGYACKILAKGEQSRGEVHTMGVMLMLFNPIPFVDAGSSWAFQSKWKRIFVSGAGIYVELMIATVAAWVWTQSPEGDPVHVIAYNVMLVTSVTTLLFNGNPLLRYDAYYMLTDLLEIPNLSQRSKEYFNYLVKRYVWGIKTLSNPAHDRRETYSLFSYAVASYIYRIFLFAGITFFIAEHFIIFGIICGLIYILTFLIIPFGKFLYYLKTSPELRDHRLRACSLSFIFFTLLSFAAFKPKVAHWERAEGVLLPQDIQKIYSRNDAFVTELLNSETAVSKGKTLLKSHRPQLLLEIEENQQKINEYRIQEKLEKEKEKWAELKISQAKRKALLEKKKSLYRELKTLELTAPFDGQWVSSLDQGIVGAYIHRGDELGVVYDPKSVFIRAVVDQKTAYIIQDAVKHGKDAKIRCRLKGNPNYEWQAKLVQFFDFGQESLPSEALGYSLGGGLETEHNDLKKTKSKYYEIHLRYDLKDKPFRVGQVVALRFDLNSKSFADQLILKIRQVLQQKLHI